jgi:hypothetical protein
MTPKTKLAIAALAACAWLLGPRAEVSIAVGKSAVGADCTLKGKKLFGKVQVVNAFPDLKVQIVDAFPDLNVELVDAFPDKCGKWKMTNAFPDLKVQFVTSFPDLKIKYVKSFPGVAN